MSILNGAAGKISSAQNFVKNPFQRPLANSLQKDDFDGFYIEEITEDGNGEIISLVGNMMPKVPFTFGGSQRMKKDFYPGNPEPVIQMQGSEEDDVTITGSFKEKSLGTDLKGFAEEMQGLVDSVRLRGNVVKIRMGEWERYAVVSRVKFEFNKLSEIEYTITFAVFGFFQPTNARFLAESREIPYDLNDELIAQGVEFAKLNSQIPSSIPFSVADAINALTSAIAEGIALVTNFIDTVISSVNAIQKSITRIKGMIKYLQNKLREYKRFLGSFQPFSDSQALTGRYSGAKFASSGISSASKMTSLLELLRKKISAITPTIPLGRHLVVSGDSLQKVSIKFYKTADNWKKIYDFNGLTDTNLTAGQILEIPRV